MTSSCCFWLEGKRLALMMSCSCFLSEEREREAGHYGFIWMLILPVWRKEGLDIINGCGSCMPAGERLAIVSLCLYSRFQEENRWLAFFLTATVRLKEKANTLLL